MFFIAGFSIACFLLFLFLFKKRKEVPDYILASWLVIIALHLALHYLRFSELDIKHPWLLGIILPIPVLHALFLYFYTITLTENRIPRVPVIFLHFIPFFCLIGLAIPFYTLTPAEKVTVFKNQGQGFEWYSIVQLSFILLSGAFYSLATILKIRTHRRKIQDYLSNTDQKMLRWLEYLVVGLGLIWLLTLFFDDTIIFGGVTVFILFIGFFGINQISIFTTISVANSSVDPNPTSIPDSENKKEKYLKSGLEREQVSMIMSKLEQFMTQEKPFKESELTLNDLARRMDLNPNQLSQVINSETGNTFYHYINTFRINEFLYLLSLPENKKFTFLALAYDCGFNSKTTFNKYFRIQTGKTPTEYFSTI
ncbi:helix-turn-helix domain-containing protein [Fluviicola taffensis]|uniref:Helix-turn-helix, AraC domain protein n=1 Tax=Fluviicola taffensis (strain DSM 16823 / NCIMB 13979 / RW262) TaxID=755732 RepID=F2IAU0_FLUTR|nr:helix-turn-helix domain-containing protein [Fluviicola taffensis]AEA44245.1 Helix-turn-helix, AraC domain protein [Fluviicola taffensis DSM 16823]